MAAAGEVAAKTGTQCYRLENGNFVDSFAEGTQDSFKNLYYDGSVSLQRLFDEHFADDDDSRFRLIITKNLPADCFAGLAKETKLKIGFIGFKEAATEDSVAVVKASGLSSVSYLCIFSECLDLALAYLKDNNAIDTVYVDNSFQNKADGAAAAAVSDAKDEASPLSRIAEAAKGLFSLNNFHWMGPQGNFTGFVIAEPTDRHSKINQVVGTSLYCCRRRFPEHTHQSSVLPSVSGVYSQKDERKLLEDLIAAHSLVIFGHPDGTKYHTNMQKLVISQLRAWFSDGANERNWLLSPCTQLLELKVGQVASLTNQEMRAEIRSIQFEAFNAYARQDETRRGYENFTFKAGRFKDAKVWVEEHCKANSVEQHAHYAVILDAIAEYLRYLPGSEISAYRGMVDSWEAESRSEDCPDRKMASACLEDAKNRYKYLGDSVSEIFTLAAAIELAMTANPLGDWNTRSHQFRESFKAPEQLLGALVATGVVDMEALAYSREPRGARAAAAEAPFAVAAGASRAVAASAAGAGAGSGGAAPKAVELREAPTQG